MKITAARVEVVRVPFAYPKAWALGVAHDTTRTVIVLETDAGLTGVGEGPGEAWTVARIRKMAPLLVGLDPFDSEMRFAILWGQGPAQYPRSALPAVGALDLACWDLVGQACGQPLYRLLGGSVASWYAGAAWEPGLPQTRSGESGPAYVMTSIPAIRE